MSNMVLARPLAPVDITASHGTASDQNLMTDDPREMWLGTATGAAVFTLDLASVQVIGSLFAGFTNAPRGTTWSATAGRAAGNETTLFATTLFTGKHALQLFTPTAARYVAVTITPPPGWTLQAGILFAGPYFQPVWGHEWGSGRPIIDTGARDRLIGGGFGINRGAIVSGYSWTLGDLTDREVQQLYGFAMDRGQTRPLVLAEDPAVALGTLAAGANVEFAGRTATKTTGDADAWDASFAMSEIRDGGCYLSWTAPAANKAYQLGISGSIDGAFALSLETDGTMSAFIEAEVGAIGVGSYAAGDSLAIEYDGGGKVEFSKNGASLYLVGATPGQTMTMAGSFRTAGGQAADLYFGEHGVADRLHYGLMTIDKYERLSPGRTRWNLSIEDWV